MGALSYSTNHFLRRMIVEDGQVLSAAYFEKEEVEKGMIFLGRVESFHAPLKGYFVDLGNGVSGLYQSSEQVLIGKHYLFEIHTAGRGRPHLLSRRIGFVGNYVIFRPGNKSGYSKYLSEKAKKRLHALSQENVYYRKEAETANTMDILEEIRSLREVYEEVASLERTQRRAHPVYRPPYPQETDDLLFILEYEEEILRLAQKTVFDDEMTYYVEPTQVGLVIDVNSGGSKLSVPELNDKAVMFISDLLIRMNAGGLILVDLIGHGEQKNPLNLKKKDPRITHVALSEMGILEITRKRNGTNMYDVPILVLLADYIQLQIQQREKDGVETKGVSVSKRYAGIEEYLDTPVEYSEVFGWFRFL